jgi:hypothetical protein
VGIVSAKFRRTLITVLLLEPKHCHVQESGDAINVMTQFTWFKVKLQTVNIIY